MRNLKGLCSWGGPHRCCMACVQHTSAKSCFPSLSDPFRDYDQLPLGMATAGITASVTSATSQLPQPMATAGAYEVTWLKSEGINMTIVITCEPVSPGGPPQLMRLSSDESALSLPDPAVSLTVVITVPPASQLPTPAGSASVVLKYIPPGPHPPPTAPPSLQPALDTPAPTHLPSSQDSQEPASQEAGSQPSDPSLSATPGTHARRISSTQGSAKANSGSWTRASEAISLVMVAVAVALALVGMLL